MLQLDLARWQKLWLNRPWEIHSDPATGMIEVNGVRGYLVPGDIEYLFNLARALPVGGNYLEVGSWMGLSSIVVANGLISNLNFRATIYCVDTWRGSPEHQELPEVQQDLLYQCFQKNIAEAQVDGLIRPVRDASIDVAKAWTGPLPDIIFIDGDHSTEACYLDIFHWQRILKPGGRLLGHDAVPRVGRLNWRYDVIAEKRGCVLAFAHCLKVISSGNCIKKTVSCRWDIGGLIR